MEKFDFENFKKSKDKILIKISSPEEEKKLYSALSEQGYIRITGVDPENTLYWDDNTKCMFIDIRGGEEWMTHLINEIPENLQTHKIIDFKHYIWRDVPEYMLSLF